MAKRLSSLFKGQECCHRHLTNCFHLNLSLYTVMSLLKLLQLPPVQVAPVAGITTEPTTEVAEPEHDTAIVKWLQMTLLVSACLLLITIELTLLYCLRRLLRPLVPEQPIAVQNDGVFTHPTTNGIQLPQVPRRPRQSPDSGLFR